MYYSFSLQSLNIKRCDFFFLHEQAGKLETSHWKEKDQLDPKNQFILLKNITESILIISLSLKTFNHSNTFNVLID